MKEKLYEFDDNLQSNKTVVVKLMCLQSHAQKTKGLEDILGRYCLE